MNQPHRDLPQRDELQLQRYLDDRLNPAERAAFAARLLADPALQAAETAARSLRTAFAAARTEVRTPSSAFTANVLAAARRLPARHELQQADLAAGAVATCRKLLLAALLLAGLGLLWHSGLAHDQEPADLQAAPGDVQREIERLDRLLESGAVPPRSEKK
jgi:anti-sigma factor RsiW